MFAHFLKFSILQVGKKNDDINDQRACYQYFLLIRFKQKSEPENWHSLDLKMR